MQSMHQYVYIRVFIFPLQIKGITLPYMMKRVAFLGHLNLVCSHLDLENQAEASLALTRSACLAEQLAMELPATVVVIADYVLEATVELVEKIGVVDFEEAFQH